MAAIERVSPSLEEAAQNLGASWAQTFARVIVPLSMPGLVSGALLVFSASMSAFITPALMGGRRVRMVGQQIYEEVLTAYDWPGAASLTIVLSLMLGLVSLALWSAPGSPEHGARRWGRSPLVSLALALAVYALLLAPWWW
jgi:ABC-type spermidine/putrescine transport system permease subunit I